MVAFERLVAGLEKRRRVLTMEERKRVAYHEMGHALVAANLPGVDPSAFAKIWMKAQSWFSSRRL